MELPIFVSANSEVKAERVRSWSVQIRVLSVQRTHQKFNARAICEARAYSYFLPTSILGLKLDGAPAPARPSPLQSPWRSQIPAGFLVQTTGQTDNMTAIPFRTI